jgi:hypothetical protein
MTHSAEHHLEEAEHAKHAAHSPFDRRVAVTMAIVAASLACVTLLSHREHNASTAHQIDASNTWNRYQAKKNRGYMYAANAELLNALSAGQTSAVAEKSVSQAGKWEKKARDYEESTKEIEKEARDYQEQCQQAHHRSNYFDLGELGLELGLVLCSVAVLSKRAGFWYSGMGVSIAGLAVAAYGFLVVTH